MYITSTVPSKNILNIVIYTYSVLPPIPVRLGALLPTPVSHCIGEVEEG